MTKANTKTKNPCVAVKNKELKAEARIVTKMLREKVVKKIWRHTPLEIGIQFEDGTTLFVDIKEEGLELSIHEG